MALSKQLSDEQKDQTLDWLESTVLNHPEYGREVKRILKKVDARIQFPEIEAEDVIEVKTKAQEERLEKFLQDQKDKENKAWIEGERRKARDSGFVTDEQQPEFEKWMTDNHMGNYQIAAKYYHDEVMRPAEPTNYAEVRGIQLPSHKGLFENPNKWGRDEAYKAIAEMERAKRGRE